MVIIGLFYVLLFAFLVFLFFLIILYSGYVSRIIVPSLNMKHYTILDNTHATEFKAMSIDQSATNALSLGADSQLGFIPSSKDRQRILTGKIVLLLSASATSDIYLRVVDNGDTGGEGADGGKIIGSETRFTVGTEDDNALTTIKINFTTNVSSSVHKIALEIKGPDTIKVNSAYVYYY